MRRKSFQGKRVLKLPRLMLGTSPFIAAGQFGLKAMEYYSRFYLNPSNIAKVYREAYELGVKALQLVASKPTIQALELANVKFHLTVSIYGDFEKTLRKIERFKPEIVAVHAEIADSLNLPKIEGCLREVKRVGAVPAAATHLPGRTIPALDKLGEVEVYLAPLNRLGLFMEPDPEETLKALRETPAKIIAIKPLAAGRLNPREAFEYVYGIADSAAVGMTSRSEIVEALEALEALGLKP